MWSKLKLLIAGSLLLFQLGMIGYARFVPTRFFCWGPYDSQNKYEVQVVLKGRELTRPEVEARYRIPQRGYDSRAIAHVMKILQQYEETYGRSDQAIVKLRYTVNGKKEQVWQWAPQ
jgi:hypothetical protein